MKLYWCPRTRASRAVWCLEEVGELCEVDGVDEAADAWHAAGVANGGEACEEPPGVREGGLGKLYLAYLRDPAGNKLCALHQMGS